MFRRHGGILRCHTCDFLYLGHALVEATKKALSDGNKGRANALLELLNACTWHYKWQPSDQNGERRQENYYIFYREHYTQIKEALTRFQEADVVESESSLSQCNMDIQD